MEAPALPFVIVDPIHHADLDLTTAAGFKVGLERLGLSIREAEIVFGTIERTLRKWMDTKRKTPPHGPNPAAAVLLKMYLDGIRPSNWPLEV